MDFDKRRKLLSLIESIAEALAGQWDMNPFPEDWGRIGAWLTNPKNHAQLVIGESQTSPVADPNRLTVSTDYPKDSHGNTAHEPRPKISVSGAKKGSQIAGDIERRLLPEYLPLLEKVLARYAAYDKAEDETITITRQIAHVVGVKHDPKSSEVSFYHSPYKIFAETMSQAEAVGDNEIDLHLRLDSRTAIKVLNLLTKGRFEDPGLSDL